MEAIAEKFLKVEKETPFLSMEKTDQNFLKEKIFRHRLTFQQSRKLVIMALDFRMWDEGDISNHWPISLDSTGNKKRILASVENNWSDLKNGSSDYSSCSEKFSKNHKFDKLSFVPMNKPIDDKIFGRCPVASPKTLCCNLQTLDAVDNCSFDCSYCSIQSFFPEKKVWYTSNLKEKLKNITLDPGKRHHIGTGQSSDSLLVGNRGGVLKALFEFANSNSNLILELKTKSKNINYLLDNEIPKNVFTTWSLNTPTIIKAEEHGTASLEDRISSARKIADKGNLVGFHFHPMIFYNEHKKDYTELVKTVLNRFDVDEVALISIGTLTFAKPVISTIRNRPIYSKVLQIPLVESAGKFTYPIETKLELFSNLYENFKDWHGKVFFYFCMEDRRYWREIFKYEYETNDDFEKALLDSYFSKATTIGHV